MPPKSAAAPAVNGTAAAVPKQKKKTSVSNIWQSLNKLSPFANESKEKAEQAPQGENSSPAAPGENPSSAAAVAAPANAAAAVAAPANAAAPSAAPAKKKQLRKKGGAGSKKGYKEPPPGILPPQSEELRGRLTIVLDMDETLLHSVFTMTKEKEIYRQEEARQATHRLHDFEISLEGEEEDEDETAFVFIRPGLKEFLDECCRLYETVVFTAALAVYAKPVLDRVDPEGRIHHRLYREATVTYRGQPFVKDLSKLGRDMNRIILVDNNPYAMMANPDNGMPILSYYDDPEDRELEKALVFFRQLQEQPDVRVWLRKKFNFRPQLKQL